VGGPGGTVAIPAPSAGFSGVNQGINSAAGGFNATVNGAVGWVKGQILQIGDLAGPLTPVPPPGNFTGGAFGTPGDALNVSDTGGLLFEDPQNIGTFTPSLILNVSSGVYAWILENSGAGPNFWKNV
jgi:hypothetical protein